MSETCTVCQPIDACQLSLSASDYRRYSYPTNMARSLWCRPAKPGLHGEHHEITYLVVSGSHVDSDNCSEMHLRLMEIK